MSFASCPELSLTRPLASSLSLCVSGFIFICNIRERNACTVLCCFVTHCSTNSASVMRYHGASLVLPRRRLSVLFQREILARRDEAKRSGGGSSGHDASPTLNSPTQKRRLRRRKRRSCWVRKEKSRRHSLWKGGDAMEVEGEVKLTGGLEENLVESGKSVPRSLPLSGL